MGSSPVPVTYNAYGELTEYSSQYNGTDIFRSQYHLDAVGRIDTLWENVLGKQNKFVYNYDISGRLEKVFRNDTLISTNSYDSNGNRLYHATQTDTLFGSYDDQDRMLAYGNTIYQYNAQGSLTTKISGQDTTHYIYDLMGNLISVKLSNGDFIEYLIDAQNRRVGKIVNGQVVRKWLYQDQLNPVAEFDSNDSLIARFVYGSKAHVPDYVVKGDTIYRVITDHLGSVRAVVNVATGEIVQEISYNEFGVVLWNTNPEFQPFAYAGGLCDTSTGLIRFGARDYDCFTGRWTAKNPIKFNGRQLNLYVYSYNDPVNYIDPTGLPPHGPYKSQHDAAIAAMNDVFQQSIDEDVEYGGRVFKNECDKKYYYSDPLKGETIKDEKGNLVNKYGSTGLENDDPCGYKTTAYYHTHGAETNSGDFYDEENFSDDGPGTNTDIPTADYYEVDAYLKTPSGRVLYYNHYMKMQFTL